MTRHSHGFTIIEVLLAMGIFIAGVTAVLGLFQTGGGMETAARAHSSLAPAIEPLIDDLRREVWSVDASGGVTALQERKGETVPGAPDYRYDLEIEPAGANPDLRRAAVRFYRTAPERPAATVRFLLPRHVPLARRLSQTN